MKDKLTFEKAKGMTWGEVFEYYFPDFDLALTDFVFWNETCYPFDTEKTLDQIYEYYLKNDLKLKI